MNVFAVIPTHNRFDDLVELLDTIPPDVHILVIDNASDRDVRTSLPLRFLGRRLRVIQDPEQPPNLSRLWNVGFDWAEQLYRAGCKLPVEFDQGDDWAVAILNDDVVLPVGFFELMTMELKAHKVDIAFPGPPNETCFVNTKYPFPGVGLRMTGWCFVVRGGSGLRADERLRWWCGDDDLQASAVRHGRGTVRVEMKGSMAHELRHKHPDESTAGVLAEQTHGDMEAFTKKWGRRPW